MLLRLSHEQVRVLTQHSWSPVSIADVQTSPVAARKTAFLWAGPCLAEMRGNVSSVEGYKEERHEMSQSCHVNPQVIK